MLNRKSCMFGKKMRNMETNTIKSTIKFQDGSIEINPEVDSITELGKYTIRRDPDNPLISQTIEVMTHDNKHVVVLTIGVLTTTVANAGQYSVVPTNPISQLATSGSGTGATFTGTFGDGAQILYDNRRTGFVKLQVAESASAIVTAVNAL